MKKTKKGLSKILILIIILGIIMVSAIMFGYGGEGVQEVKEDITNKAGEVVSDAADGAVTNVVDEGQEVIGKKLKEVGEKMLEDDENSGYWGLYGDEDVIEYDNVVLFFTADWCPSCIEAEENIESEKNDIPTNVAIVKVDFDDKELKQEYGVSKQHTFVLINENGEENKKWIGSKKLSEIIDNIK